MPSPAAQQMFNSLSPEEQARVTASLAGNPNGLDDWYQGAARAGDPRAIRAGGVGQSEDFARFNEGTVTGWAQGYYDEAASRAAGRPQFRSMRGAQGFFDKPTECPPGTGPSGPNETDPCTTKGYSEPAGGPAGTAGAGTGSGVSGVNGGVWWRPNQPGASTGLGTATAPNSVGWNNPNINPLGGPLGGAQSWNGTGSRPAPLTAPNTVGWTNPAIGPTGGPLGGAQVWGGSGSRPAPSANTGTLASILAPLQQQAAPNPLQGAVMPFQTQRRRVDPLTGMLGQQQSGRWF